MLSQALPWACMVWWGKLSMVEGRQRRLKFITACFWPTPVPKFIFVHFLKTKAKQLPSDYNHSWKQRPMPTCVFSTVSLLSFPLSKSLWHFPVECCLKWKCPCDRSRIMTYVHRACQRFRAPELYCNDTVQAGKSILTGIRKIA